MWLVVPVRLVVFVWLLVVPREGVEVWLWVEPWEGVEECDGALECAGALGFEPPPPPPLGLCWPQAHAGTIRHNENTSHFCTIFSPLEVRFIPAS